MDKVFSVDWGKAFTPDTPVAEIVLRGTLVYLVIFAFLRILKREAGSVGITDLLVLVLIADAAQNAMAADYTSITDGLILVATILFWSYTLDWLGYHVRWVDRLVRAQPVLLIRDGRVIRPNLRKELITEEELMGQLRLQGTEDLTEVRCAHVEADGRISVVTRDQQATGAPERQQA